MHPSSTTPGVSRAWTAQLCCLPVPLRHLPRRPRLGSRSVELDRRFFQLQAEDWEPIPPLICQCFDVWCLPLGGHRGQPRDIHLCQSYRGWGLLVLCDSRKRVVSTNVGLGIKHLDLSGSCCHILNEGSKLYLVFLRSCIEKIGIRANNWKCLECLTVSKETVLDMLNIYFSKAFSIKRYSISYI